jgi:hypothetical protein
MRTNAGANGVEWWTLSVNLGTQVTGTLALGSVAAPTGTGLATVTGGAWDAASASVAAGFLTFAATPSSANLRSLVTDETGTGALVFGTSPTFLTSTSYGASPSTFGEHRYTNNEFLWWRGGGANYQVLGLDASDVITLGGSGADIVINASTAGDIVCTAQFMGIDANNVQFGSAVADDGGGVGVIGIDEAASNPSSSPTSGIVAYVDATDNTLKYRKETGVTVTLHGSAGTCTLEMFGAVGDGATSDQAALAAARSAISAGQYDTLILGAKTYLITGCDSSNPWPMGGNVIGQGSASVLKTATDGPVFLFKDTDAADRAKNTLLAHFRIEGSSTGTNQNGVEVGYLGGDGTERLRVLGCTFNSLGGRGVSVYAAPNIAGPQIIGCKFYSCLYGIYAVNHTDIVGCQFTSCTTGVRVEAGNVSVTGGSMISCTTGLRVIAGGNDGHGAVSGVEILHCTTPVQFGAIANGHLFTGCTIYEGTILFDGSNTGAVVFDGCLIDATVYTLVGKARFLNCTFDQSYYSSSSTTGGDNEFVSCRDIDGTVPSWIADLVQVSFTYPSDANATLSAQQSRAELININAGVITAGRDLVSAHTPGGAKSRQIVIRNNTAQTVTYKWSSGSGVAIASGIALRIGSDGTNAIQIA